MTRKLKKIFAMTLLAAFLFLFTAGCAPKTEPNPQNPLQGQWKDTYGLTQYSFLDDHNLVLTAYGFADFPGTYTLNKDGTIQIRYSFLGKERTNTYSFDFSGNQFFLDKNEFIRKK